MGLNFPMVPTATPATRDFTVVGHAGAGNIASNGVPFPAGAPVKSVAFTGSGSGPKNYALPTDFAAAIDGSGNLVQLTGDDLSGGLLVVTVAG